VQKNHNHHPTTHNKNNGFGLKNCAESLFRNTRGRIFMSSSSFEQPFIDYYELLEISRDANMQQIKDAYRYKAKLYHPDVNFNVEGKAGEDTKEKFQAVNQAHEVLSHPQLKQQYDARLNGIGKETPGKDLRFYVDIDFTTSVFGGEKTVRIRHMETCDKCYGLGRISIPGQKGPCTKCGGTGVVSKVKEFNIEIPSRADNGKTILYKGMGDAGAFGGPPGDLTIVLDVKKQFGDPNANNVVVKGGQSSHNEGTKNFMAERRRQVTSQEIQPYQDYYNDIRKNYNQRDPTARSLELDIGKNFLDERRRKYNSIYSPEFNSKHQAAGYNDEGGNFLDERRKLHMINGITRDDGSNSTRNILDERRNLTSRAYNFNDDTNTNFLDERRKMNNMINGISGTTDNSTTNILDERRNSNKRAYNFNDNRETNFLDERRKVTNLQYESEQHVVPPSSAQNIDEHGFVKPMDGFPVDTSSTSSNGINSNTDNINGQSQMINGNGAHHTELNGKTCRNTAENFIELRRRNLNFDPSQRFNNIPEGHINNHNVVFPEPFDGGVFLGDNRNKEKMNNINGEHQQQHHHQNINGDQNNLLNPTHAAPNENYANQKINFPAPYDDTSFDERLIEEMDRQEQKQFYDYEYDETSFEYDQESFSEFLEEQNFFDEAQQKVQETTSGLPSSTSYLDTLHSTIPHYVEKNNTTAA